VRDKNRQAAFAIAEPVNMDLDRETESRPRGNTAFSHNYPHLFRTTGYELLFTRVEPVNPDVPFYSNVMVIATTGLRDER